MKLRYKMIILFITMISVLCIVTGTYSIINMKDKIIQSARSKLLSDISLSRELIDAYYPGDWTIQDDILYKGDFSFKDQFDLVDKIGQLTGDTVTIFQGDTRLVTNVILDTGNRAVNTQVSEIVAKTVLTNGETYTGVADVVGTMNQTIYEPIKDISGTIIGILYVGVPNTPYDNMASDFSFNLITFTMIGLIIFSLIIWYFSTKISKPLIDLEHKTRQIADGDLSLTIDIVSKDEIGSLSTSFNKMIDNLNEVLHNISDASSEVFSDAKHIALSSNSLAQGATEQASTVEELSISLDNITNKMKSNAHHSQTASEFANKIKESSLKSSHQLKDMQSAIDIIYKTSHDIKQVIKAIDNIAFQTNILALNASVEAARAGKYGLGFAVVAEEVRTLANQSAEAVKNTSRLIEASIENVNSGTKIASETAESLTYIIEGINSMAESIEEINNSNNHQTLSIEEIYNGINQFSDVIQNTSGISEENSAASTELSSQAELLNVQVKKFKLKK